MSLEIEKRVATLIDKGKSKKEIFHMLSAEMDVDDFERFLRNQTELSKKESYHGWNLLLVVFVAAASCYKMGHILTPLIEYGVHNALLTIWGFLVPSVNLCFAWLIYRYNRLGYFGLFIFSILSLLRPENHNAVGLLQTIPLIALSGFLYLKLFPKGGRNY